jgi:hypothetical protein
MNQIYEKAKDISIDSTMEENSFAKLISGNFETINNIYNINNDYNLFNRYDKIKYKNIEIKRCTKIGELTDNKDKIKLNKIMNLIDKKYIPLYLNNSQSFQKNINDFKANNSFLRKNEEPLSNKNNYNINSQLNFNLLDLYHNQLKIAEPIDSLEDINKKNNILINNNEVNSTNPKRKKIKKIFSLKEYDDNKNLIRKKRGRRALVKKSGDIHTSYDTDNILRKIQVHCLTFLVSFTNDYIDTLYPKVKSKNIPYFRHFDYKLKRTINHITLKRLKSLKIGDILQSQASPKHKLCAKNINQMTFIKLCNDFPFLKDKYFNISFRDFFNQFYIKTNENFVDFNGNTIHFSKRTENFNQLIRKNIPFQEKYKKIATNFYLPNDEIKGNYYYNKDNNMDEKRQKPLFVLY